MDACFVDARGETRHLDKALLMPGVRDAQQLNKRSIDCRTTAVTYKSSDEAISSAVVQAVRSTALQPLSYQQAAARQPHQ